MRSRGADRPDDDADLRNEQAGRGRRLFGRGRPEPVEPEEVPREETGWLDDLRTAKEERAAIGPGKASDGRSSKSGKVAPGPDDAADDGPGFPGAGPDARADSAAPAKPRSSAAPISAARPGRGRLRRRSVAGIPVFVAGQWRRVPVAVVGGAGQWWCVPAAVVGRAGQRWRGGCGSRTLPGPVRRLASRLERRLGRALHRMAHGPGPAARRTSFRLG